MAAAAVVYRIRSQDEETDCNHCGMPLNLGDYALDYNDQQYCGLACAISDQRYQREHSAAVASLSR